MQIDVSGQTRSSRKLPPPTKAQPNLGDNPTSDAASHFLNEFKSLCYGCRQSCCREGSIVISRPFAILRQYERLQRSTVASSGSAPVTSTNPPADGLAAGLRRFHHRATLVYVANYNSNSVSVINTSLNVVTNSATVGVHPVSLDGRDAKRPQALRGEPGEQHGQQLEHRGSVLEYRDWFYGDESGMGGGSRRWPEDLRADARRRATGDHRYGYGYRHQQLFRLGAGANFIFYDPHLNRLYVTNPATSMVYVFSDTGGTNAGVPNDTPVQLASISFSSGSVPCPAVPTSAGCLPTSVAALPDGSRFYVATYQIASTCPDALAGATGACVIAGLTVFDANSFALEYPAAPTLNLLTYPPFAANLTHQPVSICGAAGDFLRPGGALRAGHHALPRVHRRRCGQQPRLREHV